ncbi:hypothetical protein EDB83DRAFT_2314479 [Lactarius deliciosus]|nr:hypothetical protein EDB83DRAFT_2314479 [Lactarius deliciosus]
MLYSQRRNDGVTESTLARLDSIVAVSPDVEFTALSERFRGVHCARGGGEGRRRHHSQHVPVQRRGKRITDSADNSLAPLDVPVELVRCAEKNVDLGHGHGFEHECIAAVCHGNGRGGYAVAFELGIHELEGL